MRLLAATLLAPLAAIALMFALALVPGVRESGVLVIPCTIALSTAFGTTLPGLFVVGLAIAQRRRDRAALRGPPSA